MMLPIHFKSCRDPYSCMVVFVTKMTNPQRVGMLSFVVRELSVFFLYTNVSLTGRDAHLQDLNAAGVSP